MSWIVGLVGVVAVPTLFGWWFARNGGGFFRQRWTPLRSYYDEDGRYVEPIKEWRARRAA